MTLIVFGPASHALEIVCWVEEPPKPRRDRLFKPRSWQEPAALLAQFDLEFQDLIHVVLDGPLIAIPFLGIEFWVMQRLTPAASLLAECLAERLLRYRQR